MSFVENLKNDFLDSLNINLSTKIFYKMLENLDLESIQDEKARELIRQLLNLVEQLSADLRDAQVETQRLRDEVNRMKGEQGKPNIKGNLNPIGSQHSSEKERRKPRVRHK